MNSAFILSISSEIMTYKLVTQVTNLFFLCNTRTPYAARVVTHVTKVTYFFDVNPYIEKNILYLSL